VVVCSPRNRLLGIWVTSPKCARACGRGSLSPARTLLSH